MFHRLILVGNLGRDPELKYSSNGMPMVGFPVATNHKWTDAAGQSQEETVWFRVSVYGKQAEACSQYLARGQKVLVEGTLVAGTGGGPRVYERKDGTWTASFDVRATTVRFLGGRENSGGSAAGSKEVQQEESAEEELFA